MSLATGATVLEELHTVGQVKRAQMQAFMRVPYGSIATNTADTHFLPHVGPNGLPKHRMKVAPSVQKKRQKQNTRYTNFMLIAGLGGAAYLLMFRR